MSDKQIYIAYVLDKNEFGAQLLRYAFEYKIIEFWGETEAQTELKEYFKTHHYSREEPLIVEVSDILDFMSFKDTKQ